MARFYVPADQWWNDPPQQVTQPAAPPTDADYYPPGTPGVTAPAQPVQPPGGNTLPPLPPQRSPLPDNLRGPTPGNQGGGGGGGLPGGLPRSGQLPGMLPGVGGGRGGGGGGGNNQPALGPSTPVGPDARSPGQQINDAYNWLVTQNGGVALTPDNPILLEAATNILNRTMPGVTPEGVRRILQAGRDFFRASGTAISAEEVDRYIGDELAGRPALYNWDAGSALSPPNNPGIPDVGSEPSPLPPPTGGDTDPIGGDMAANPFLNNYNKYAPAGEYNPQSAAMRLINNFSGGGGGGRLNPMMANYLQRQAGDIDNQTWLAGATGISGQNFEEQLGGKFGALLGGAGSASGANPQWANRYGPNFLNQAYNQAYDSGGNQRSFDGSNIARSALFDADSQGDVLSAIQSHLRSGNQAGYAGAIQRYLQNMFADFETAPTGSSSFLQYAKNRGLF